MAGPLGATQWMYDVAGFYPTVLEDSLKFNDDESQYLSWTPAAACLLYTSPSPRDRTRSRMPSSA